MKRLSLDGGSSTSPDTRLASSANHSMEPTLCHEQQVSEETTGVQIIRLQIRKHAHAVTLVLHLRRFFLKL